MKSKGFKIFLAVIFVSLLIGGGLFALAYNASFSEGSRTGKIMKLSKKGIVFKTYEGQLDVGGIQRSADGYAAGSVWEFSVEDNRTDVIQAIEKAMDENKRVKVHYEEKFFKFSWRGDTKNFATKIEVLNVDANVSAPQQPVNQ
jgi:hypothetical protein